MHNATLGVAESPDEPSATSIPARMQALVKGSADLGANLTEVDVPPIGPEDVLVKVLAASICGTDLHLYEWDDWARGRARLPLILGHEFAGEVVSIGSHVVRIQIGAYVAAESHINCGHCYECQHDLQHICRNVQIIGVDRDGAFAPYVCIPERNAWVTDRKFPPRIATIQEPMGNAVHAALSAPLAGANVVIFGAGPIGLFAVPIARASGAKKVVTVEPSEFRLDLARKLGSDAVVNPISDNVKHRILEETGGEGADVVLEMSGNALAIEQSLQVLRSGGFISLLGIPARPVAMDLADGVIFKGATVQGISGRRIFETWYQTRGFLDSGMDLSAVITHELPLSEFHTAFELVRTGKSGKVVLYPNGFSDAV
jgi:threonine 3-dehydrogenase